ncbi:MAG: response regulator [Acidimicrobiales bacterium]|nr:response regulator [Acidimicrobiales bacterium]
MSSPPTVLYVEDELSLHALIEFWLTEAGFVVQLALDGAEALEMIRTAPPDLVITDAMMPRVSGDELVETIKADPDLAHIPIVMATAAASPLRVQRMLERGCSAVLGKPLDEDTFIAAARKALGLADG